MKFSLLVPFAVLAMAGVSELRLLTNRRDELVLVYDKQGFKAVIWTCLVVTTFTSVQDIEECMGVVWTEFNVTEVIHQKDHEKRNGAFWVIHQFQQRTIKKHPPHSPNELAEMDKPYMVFNVPKPGKTLHQTVNSAYDGKQP
ncbi:hypothetical protein T10_13542 [Trichinella papuae]|uniref:Uncharacterized protein n=1 Tax=Trichinella papuae TaxID=268474 RepID=A0A0V1N801_9BILA|nr:hypothetical protein T10_13542 [Trichinella papuae]